MNAFFRDLPIKRKVMLVTLAASLVAIFAVASALYIFQLRNFRSNYQRELHTLAQIMADNCATTLVFHDSKSAAEVLAPLRVKTEILNAAVLDKNGKLFAKFGSEDLCPPPLPGAPASIVDRDATWMVVQPILFDGERIGTFYMDVDYAHTRSELQRLYLGVTAAALAGSLVLVVLLTTRLQSIIVNPLRLLARASKAVARDRDYSVRVEATGADEIGQLTAAFNNMLARIGEQDGALQQAGEQLQGKVLALQKEVTERKAAEEALRISQQKLLETSRLAGMAEVATGVLHNVGNVLNSVNVSAGVVLDKLRSSRAAKVSEAAELLIARHATLADYLTQDPGGQKLPGYFVKLGQQLAEENTALLAEMDRLTRNIEHIKEVVSMQQSYAKISGLSEELSIARLVEDALAMNGDSLTRHGITLVRHFTPAALVRADRHRVLQILINLLRNAKNALNEALREDKQITFSIVQADDKIVRVSITDNGIGIAPENLTLIFGHGFTTRRDGHGFGLHSGALAAKEMGCTLSVHSDGLGHGATFTLDLPIASRT